MLYKEYLIEFIKKLYPEHILRPELNYIILAEMCLIFTENSANFK